MYKCQFKAEILSFYFFEKKKVWILWIFVSNKLGICNLEYFETFSSLIKDEKLDLSQFDIETEKNMWQWNKSRLTFQSSLNEKSI